MTGGVGPWRNLRPALADGREAVAKALVPDGPLTARKVFARRQVVVASRRHSSALAGGS